MSLILNNNYSNITSLPNITNFSNFVLDIIGPGTAEPFWDEMFGDNIPVDLVTFIVQVPQTSSGKLLFTNVTSSGFTLTPMGGNSWQYQSSTPGPEGSMHTLTFTVNPELLPSDNTSGLITNITYNQEANGGSMPMSRSFFGRPQQDLALPSAPSASISIDTPNDFSIGDMGTTFNVSWSNLDASSEINLAIYNFDLEEPFQILNMTGDLTFTRRGNLLGGEGTTAEVYTITATSGSASFLVKAPASYTDYNNTTYNIYAFMSSSSPVQGPIDRHGALALSPPVPSVSFTSTGLPGSDSAGASACVFTAEVQNSSSTVTWYKNNVSTGKTGLKLALGSNNQGYPYIYDAIINDVITAKIVDNSVTYTSNELVPSFLQVSNTSVSPSGEVSFTFTWSGIYTQLSIKDNGLMSNDSANMNYGSCHIVGDGISNTEAGLHVINSASGSATGTIIGNASPMSLAFSATLPDNKYYMPGFYGGNFDYYYYGTSEEVVVYVNPLTSLSTNVGTLSPTFSSSQHTYTLSVSNDTSAIDVTAKALITPYGSMYGGSVPFISGIAAEYSNYEYQSVVKNWSLSVGLNSIEVIVREGVADDPVTWTTPAVTYTVNVTRAGAPEINVKQGTNNVASGSSLELPAAVVGGDNTQYACSIENLGAANLTLTGNPLVSLSGTNADQFFISQPGSSTIAPAGSSLFYIAFYPNSVGSKTATVTIANNDSDESSYVINISGTALPGPSVSISGPGESPAIAVNTEVTFTSTAFNTQGPTTYQWYENGFGSPISGATDATLHHTFTTTGTKSIYLRITDNGIVVSSSVAKVTIIAAVPSVTVSGPITGMAGEILSFTTSYANLDFTPVYYLWFVDGNFLQGGVNSFLDISSLTASQTPHTIRAVATNNSTGWTKSQSSSDFEVTITPASPITVGDGSPISVSTPVTCSFAPTALTLPATNAHFENKSTWKTVTYFYRSFNASNVHGGKTITFTNSGNDTYPDQNLVFDTKAKTGTWYLYRVNIVDNDGLQYDLYGDTIPADLNIVVAS